MKELQVDFQIAHEEYEGVESTSLVLHVSFRIQLI